MATFESVLATPVGARLARSSLAKWLANPHGSVREADLRAAVDGQVVLITGASHGLGRACARRLAAAGATVLLVARGKDTLDQVAASITAAGGTAHVHPADLRDPDRVEALAKEILDRHGRVDVLVSNAGKSIRRSLEDSYDRFHDFERTNGVNYMGPVKLMLALLPAMRERGDGHLVNVSTAGVRIPPGPRWAAYQASKAAFDVFFRSAAAEIAADGLTATSIYMGLIHTRMSAPTAVFRGVAGMTPDEAAELVCHAIVHKPAKISPWWADTAAVVFAGSGRRIWELGVQWLYRRSRDNGGQVRS